jgi:uncharacterized protein (TIGR02270 family)
MRIAAAIVRQHAESAAFLWAQRDTLALADPVEAVAVAEIDARLAAELDGLAIAGEAAWPFLVEQYETYPEKGELFAFAVQALARGEARRIEQAMGFAQASGDAAGLLGACAWLEPARLAPMVRRWVAAPNGFARYLAAACYRLHAVDPGRLLDGFLADADPRVRGEAARLAALALRGDAAPALRERMADDDPGVRFWAAWALAELGERRAAPEALMRAIGEAPERAQDGLRTALAALGNDAARRWLSELWAEPATRPLTVRGVGMVGGREMLPWLVDRMNDPTIAVPAAAAFAEIAGPLEDPDDFFYDDPDEAAHILGAEPGSLEGRLPISERFRALLP